MKRYLALLLGVVLLFCACGKEFEPEPENDLVPEQSPDTAPSADTAPAPSVSEPEPEDAVSDEEYAAMRAGIPYGGLQVVGNGLREELPVFLDDADEIGTTIQMYAFALAVGAREVAARDALLAEHIIGTAVMATAPYAVGDATSTHQACPPELEPIGAWVRDERRGSLFWLQEHVERSIKELYGEDFTATHQEGIYDIGYNATVGVYYNRPRGGGYTPYTVVLGYEDLGERYRVEVAYLQRNVGVYQDSRTGKNIADYGVEGVTEILSEYVQDPANRYLLYLKKQGDMLCFEKQTFDADAYRTAIAYEPATPPAAIEYPVLADDTAVRLADFIHGCWRMGAPPAHSFQTPQEAPRDFVLRVAMNHTGTMNNDQLTALNVHSEGHSYIREHLEQSARRVFGEDYVMEHGTWGMPFAHYDADRGVYFMDAVGLMASYEPIVTSYQREGDRYIASVCNVLYSVSGEDGYGPVYDNERPIPREEFVDYCLSQGQHVITLQENPDGSLRYLSHLLPGDSAAGAASGSET